MIPVFYDGRMVADSKGYSPSAAKPKQVVEDWLANTLPIEIRAFNRVSIGDLGRVHSISYVDGVLGGSRANGHGNFDLDIAESCRWTVGSFTTAARYALSNRVACSPTSGFHHASYNEAGGFCTFNGLMVAAAQLIDEGIAGTVGILDYDFHFGNGTQDIIENVGCDDDWDMIDKVPHVTHVGKEIMEPGEIERSIHEMGADIILYQAGADQHIDDPLGGLFTTEELRNRDRRVFRYCAKHGIPIVWCLAGGYQRDASGGIAPVLEIHRNTMIECVQAFALEL